MDSRPLAAMIDPASAGPAASIPHAEELLAFERLLAELSAGFVNLSATSVDTAIVDALRRVAGLLGVDRASLIGFAPRMGEPHLTHTWTAAGFAAAAPRPVLQEFPWAMRRLQAGDPIVMSRLDDLPEAAHVDQATWRRLGVKSNLTVPMTVGGRIEGAIALASFRHERQWPGEIVSRLRILTDVFGNALAFNRARQSLDEAMKFERLVSELLATLLTSDRAEDTDRVVEEGLRRMGELLGADGATLWAFSGDERAFHKAYRWVTTDLWTPPERVDASVLPWTVDEVVRGATVHFASLADLPPEAASDLPALRSIGVRSMMVVPVSVSGEVAQALCFATAIEEHDFPRALIPRVKLLGEVFASVLARNDAHRREQEAKMQTAHATRVGAMGAFVASLAHELTQPLAANLANAETGVRLLDASEPDLHELRATLADIVADERRAVELVQKLRRFLRRGEVERNELEVRDALVEVLQLVEREAQERGVQLRLETADALPKVVGDRVQLQQVVLNLISNAIDAAATVDGRVREVTVLADRCQDGVSIDVRDSGVGMDAHTLARIFQAFYTTKPGGMGLGLSISRTIVEAHGGSLTAQSMSGKGSVFHVQLPASVS